MWEIGMVDITEPTQLTGVESLCLYMKLDHILVQAKLQTFFLMFSQSSLRLAASCPSHLYSSLSEMTAMTHHPAHLSLHLSCSACHAVYLFFYFSPAECIPGDWDCSVGTVSTPTMVPGLPPALQCLLNE